MNGRILGQIAELHNRLSDTRFIWFPFLQLKPEPWQFLSTRALLKMTACFSGYFNLMYLIKGLIFGNLPTWGALIESQLFFFALFHIWFHVVTKPLWNHRAKQLREGRNPEGGTH